MPPPPRRGRINRRFVENVVRHARGGRRNEARSFVNPWEDGHEPFPRRPPHYEDDPHWKGGREEEGYPGPRRGYHHDSHNPRGNWGANRGRRDKPPERDGEKRVTQADPPLVLRGIPHLESSFVMTKHITEGGPPLPDDHGRGRGEGMNRDEERRWEERHMREDRRQMRGEEMRNEERFQEAQRNSHRWKDMQRHEGGQRMEEMQRDDRMRWEQERQRNEEERHWQGQRPEHEEIRQWANQQQQQQQQQQLDNRPQFHQQQPCDAPPQCSQNSQIVHTPSAVDQFVSSFRHPPPVTSQPPPIQSNQAAGSHPINPNHPVTHQNQPPSHVQPTQSSNPPQNIQGQEQASGSNQTFAPSQPIKLTDTSTLEKETERYYDELKGKNAKDKKPLSASQVANITKDYKTNEETQKQEKEKKKEKQQQAMETEQQIQTAWSILHHYWQFVRDNPYDFNGWTYLLSHVETMDNMEAARTAFEGFLPLYPYCFAYWKKLSDLEKKHKDMKRSLGVLMVGTECVPFCVELWVPLFNKFVKYAKDNKLEPKFVKSLCKRALESVGNAWQSSPLWDACINYEQNKGDLVAVMNLYRKLIATPLKLYNKHWDHFLALVRDHHPRNLLSVEEYQRLRKKSCEEMGVKYTLTSLVPPKTVKKTPQPEDKLTSLIKEKIVASYIKTHEDTEKEVDKRWKFEERIKRPYFHMKSLDRKQIKNWNEYLDFEINEGNPVNIVILFERCIIACALYEDFWIKYALYMEKHAQDVMEGKYRDLNTEKESTLDDFDIEIVETVKDNNESEKITDDKTGTIETIKESEHIKEMNTVDFNSGKIETVKENESEKINTDDYGKTGIIERVKESEEKSFDNVKTGTVESVEENYKTEMKTLENDNKTEIIETVTENDQKEKIITAEEYYENKNKTETIENDQNEKMMTADDSQTENDESYELVIDESENTETLKEEDQSETKIECIDDASDESASVNNIVEEIDESRGTEIEKESEKECPSEENDEREIFDRETDEIEERKSVERDENDISEKGEMGCSESEENQEIVAVSESGVDVDEVVESIETEDTSAEQVVEVDITQVNEGAISQVDEGDTGISEVNECEVPQVNEDSSQVNDGPQVNDDNEICDDTQINKEDDLGVSQNANTEVMMSEDFVSVSNEGSGDSKMHDSGADESGNIIDSNVTDSLTTSVSEPVICTVEGEVGEVEGKDSNEQAPESHDVEMTHVSYTEYELEINKGELQTPEAGTSTKDNEFSHSQSGALISESGNQISESSIQVSETGAQVSDGGQISESGAQISEPQTSTNQPYEQNTEVNQYESSDKETFVPQNLEQLKYMLCAPLSINETVLKCPPLTPEWIKNGVSWEDVRHVYRRGAWIHCPNKPRLLMQWAEFEEMQGNLDTCRELLRTVIFKHPTLIEARMQLIEMESRAGNYTRVEELYAEGSRAVTDIKQRSWLAIRFARFLFKILFEPDRALVVLRKALKKDRGNKHLYHHVFDICYQRQPLDTQGVLASVMLALASKELSAECKHWFAYKRVEFLKEHGSIMELKEASQKLSELKREMDKEAKEQKKEAEKKEAELAKEAAEAEKKKEENKETAGEEGTAEANVTAADGSAPTTTTTTDTTATASDPNQQFPVPYFSADGGITYNPMAGYGYGHVETNQPLPTAQEVVAAQAPGGVQGAQVPPADFQMPHMQPGWAGVPGFGKPGEGDWPNPPERYQEYSQLLEGGYPAHLRDKNIQEIKMPFKINLEHLRRRPGEPGPHLPDLSQPPPHVLDGGRTGPPNPSAGLLPLPTTLPPLGFDRPPPYSSSGPPGLPLMGRLFPPGHHDGPFPPGERPPHPHDNRSPFDDRMQFGKRRMMDNYDQGRDGPPFKMHRPDDFDPSLQHRPEYNTNYTSSPGPSAPPSHRAILEHEANMRQQQMQDRWENRGGVRESPELLRFQDPGNMDGPMSKDLELRDSNLDDITGLAVNVPEWLMRDGGELKLSHSNSGPSYLRYWPNFMTEKGEKTVFRILRKNLKWHQRRDMDENGIWQNLPHLLSWVGPCAYSKGGVSLEKNIDWLPEIVDLLHRLIQYTDNKYNSCILTLFRNGFDFDPWNQEKHPALRRDPSIASVSLGSLRMFEMQRKDGPGFLRFPLLPGSLLLMEGATQEDWEHQFPKEPNVAGERIHMTFRKMYMIQGLTV